MANFAMLLHSKKRQRLLPLFWTNCVLYLPDFTHDSFVGLLTRISRCGRSIRYLRICPAFPARPLQPASDLLSQKGQPLYAHSYRIRRVPPAPETCLGVAPNSLVQQSVPACPACSWVRAGATKVETQIFCACGYYSTAHVFSQGFLPFLIRFWSGARIANGVRQGNRPADTCFRLLRAGGTISC